jgi:uncharacterized membrane protein
MCSVKQVEVKMIRFKNSIEIKSDAEDVFNFLADFTNIPKWNYYVRDVSKDSVGDIDEHTVFHQTRINDSQTYEITTYQPYHTITIKTKPGSSLQFKRTFKLDTHDTYTVIEDIWKLDTGKHNIFEKLAFQKIKKAVSENLNKLKELLESGKTTLQDGRQVTLAQNQQSGR